MTQKQTIVFGNNVGQFRQALKLGNIGPFSSGDKSVVLATNGPQNLKKLFISNNTMCHIFMLIIPGVAQKKSKFIYFSSYLGDN